MMASRSYDVTDATMEIELAAVAQVVELSETLDIDATFPKMVASLIERAVTNGYGQQELPAMTEMLANRGE